MSRLLQARLAFILLLVAYMLPVRAQNIPFDPAVTVGRLSNGLTYYIRENALPKEKVELRLVVNIGSVNEDDDQLGLAHMAEHMAFNGTKNFKKNEIISYLQDIGVTFGNDLNAYTSFNETVYILPIPLKERKNLEKGFQILEDWAHNVSYNTEDIEDERAIILEESRAGKGAEDRMFRELYPGLFAGSKYADRLPIGKDSLIRTFDPGAIRRFYADWYRPDLMAVIVVGDIRKAEAEALIKKHFSRLKNPVKPRIREQVPLAGYTNTNVKIVTDPEATENGVGISYSPQAVKAIATKDEYRADLIEQLVTSIVNQRLDEITQKENPPFLNAYMQFISFIRGFKLPYLYAGAGDGDPGIAAAALSEAFARVQKFGFLPSELERAKKFALSQYERLYNNRDKTESSVLVEEYIRHYLDGEASPGIVWEYETVKALLPGIELTELNRLVAEIGKDENRFVYVTGPENGLARRLSGETLLAGIEKAESADITAYEEKLVTAELLNSLPPAGKIIKTSKDQRMGTTLLTLSNGITVTLKPTDFKDDQILMGATRKGGKNNYGLDDKFNAEFAVAIVQAMGVGEFSPTDLRKALAGKAVSVTPVFSAVSDGLQGSSGNKDLETLLQLSHLYLTSPRKDTALFNSFVQKNKSQYANIGSNPQAAFIDSLYRFYYDNNPLAPVNVPNSNYFDRIQLDRALEIYQERFGNVWGMDFVFVGSFDEAAILPLLEKYLGSLPAYKAEFSFKDNKVRPRPGNNLFTFNRGAEQQSLILGFYSGEIPHTEGMNLKLQAMSEVLNIRIIEELREKVQGIYGGGTFASVEKIPYSRYQFVLQLPCGPEKVDTLLKAVQHEFDLLIQQGPDQSYMQKVKQQWKEQHRTAVRENSTWLNRIMNFNITGGDHENFLNYETRVDALTAADVQEMAKLVLGGKNKLIAVLMPENTEKPQEKKQGF